MSRIALTATAQGGRVLETRQGPRSPTSSLEALALFFGKFALVGGLGALVNTGALIGLYSYARLPLVASSALATEVAIAHNFLWNNYWTFGRRSLSLGRFARFTLVSLAGQGMTVATLWLLVRYIGLYFVIANLAAIGLALIWNFAANYHWTWGSACDPKR
jgi:dolichol-phosphate mannosyltransferase